MSNKNFTVFGNTITVHNIESMYYLHRLGFRQYNNIHGCECMRKTCHPNEKELIIQQLTKYFKIFELEEGETEVSTDDNLYAYPEHSYCTLCV